LRRGERLAALFLFGLAAFGPAMLQVFGAPVLVLGLPKLLLWTFAAWAALIVLVALVVERGGPPEGD
jgi:hypothetical protein